MRPPNEISSPIQTNRVQTKSQTRASGIQTRSQTRLNEQTVIPRQEEESRLLRELQYLGVKTDSMENTSREIRNLRVDMEQICFDWEEDTNLCTIDEGSGISSSKQIKHFLMPFKYNLFLISFKCGIEYEETKITLLHNWYKTEIFLYPGEII